MSKQNIQNIVIFTNGTIMPRIEELQRFDKNKTVFYISYYGIKNQKPDKMAELLEQAGIAYYKVNFTQSAWIKHSDIEYVEMDEEKRNALFAVCVGKSCPVVSEDKFYLCEYIANCCRLRAVPENSNNYIILDENNPDLKRQLKGYIETQKAPSACSYCTRLFHNNSDAAKVKPGIQAASPLEYTKY